MRRHAQVELVDLRRIIDRQESSLFRAHVGWHLVQLRARAIQWRCLHEPVRLKYFCYETSYLMSSIVASFHDICLGNPQLR